MKISNLYTSFYDYFSPARPCIMYVHIMLFISSKANILGKMKSTLAVCANFVWFPCVEQ